MIATQQPLFKSAPTDEHVQQLILLLLQARGWRTREQISEATGWPERRIRQYAAAAVDDKNDPIIIPWQRGFCHREFVPEADIMRAAGQHEHQGQEQIKKSIGLRRVAFRKLKGWLK
jgi:hypothetical protein